MFLHNSGMPGEICIKLIKKYELDAIRKKLILIK